MTLVSVVIPAYNQGRFVAEAVESALCQSHSAIEVIVVDDGSTDNTPAILDAFSDRQRLRVIRQKNRGLPAARNRGLADAGGEFVVFLDSDDRLAPTFVERLLPPLKADQRVAFAYADVQMIDADGQPSGDFSVGQSRRIVTGDIFESLLVGGYFPPHAALVRRSAVDAAGGFGLDLGGHADYEMWLRLTASGGRAVYVDDRLVDYRVYDGTMSRDSEHMRVTRERALTRIMRDYPERVARGCSTLQELCVDLHAANTWLRQGAATALRDAETLHTAPSWALLDRLDQARLVRGKSSHLAVWDTTLGGTWSKAVFLHPPAVLEASIPTGTSGRLKASIAIHPDAWAHANACPCTFVLDVDRVVATTALLDPARRIADQRWIDLAIDVPETSTGEHRVTLETQAVGQPLYGWALFKDVRFFATAR